MDPLYFKVPRLDDETVWIEEWDQPHFFDPVHMHEDCQISYIIEGQGTILSNFEIDSFDRGDLLLFGKNLPHALRNTHQAGSKGSKLQARAISLFFSEDVFLNIFHAIPEFEQALNLLESMKYGLKIDKKDLGQIGSRIKKMIRTDGTLKILTLIEILLEIAKCENIQPLSDSVLKIGGHKNNLKLNKVYDYLLKNYMMPIKLKEVAALVNMTPNSFCRFFKNRTNKTLTELLIEIRINRACKLIVNEKCNVNEAYMACGYNSSSNFHRHFRKITKLTPTEYVKKVNALSVPR